LRLVFNLQNHASKHFYFFLHILSQSSSSLLHPSRVAAAAAHRRSSQPLLAQAHSIGSSLVLATISILLLLFLPLSFLFRAAPRAFPARRAPRAPSLHSAALCVRSAARVAPGCAARCESPGCAAPCTVRIRAALGTRRAAQGTRARGAARFCTLMTQPAPGTGSPTNDIHSACTPRVPPPALLPSTPAERPSLSPLRSQSPRHAPPTRSRQPARLASPRPRLRLAGLSRPPAHRATRAARPLLAP
jgi:hypothetical protein